MEWSVLKTVVLSLHPRRYEMPDLPLKRLDERSQHYDVRGRLAGFNP
jgi:hypothetical protein